MTLDWPVAHVDAVARLRALAAGLPHVALDETVVDAPIDAVWDIVGDLEHGVPLVETGVRSPRITERRGERLVLETAAPLGLRLRFDVLLRPHLCVMRSAWVDVGMAVRAEGGARTRFAHFEGSRRLGRAARPLFRWSVRDDFARLARLLGG